MYFLYELASNNNFYKILLIYSIFFQTLLKEFLPGTSAFLVKRHKKILAFKHKDYCLFCWNCFNLQAAFLQ